MAMEQLRNFTMSKLHEKLALPDNDFDAWLEELGLIHARRTCAECGGAMSIKTVADRRYGTWRCKKKGCRKERGFFVGTFFEGSHLTTKQIFHLSYWWARQYGTYEDIAQEIGIQSQAICDWLNFFRDVCADHFLHNPAVIGGPGVHVEVDETCVVRRKYGVGRVPIKQQVWLFGGVERNADGTRCFMVPVERRRAQDLIPLIQEHIRPGSIIHSDCWRAYGRIPNLPQGYTHFTVNHSRNFVDPHSGSHTQNVESMWGHFKRNRHHYGNTSDTYDTYFPEFMWRKQFGDRANIFYNFWHHVSLFYPYEH